MKIKKLLAVVLVACMVVTPFVAADTAHASDDKSSTFFRAVPALIGGALAGLCLYGVRLWSAYQKLSDSKKIQKRYEAEGTQALTLDGTIENNQREFNSQYRPRTIAGYASCGMLAGACGYLLAKIYNGSDIKVTGGMASGGIAYGLGCAYQKRAAIGNQLKRTTRDFLDERKKCSNLKKDVKSKQSDVAAADAISAINQVLDEPGESSVYGPYFRNDTRVFCHSPENKGKFSKLEDPC